MEGEFWNIGTYQDPIIQGQAGKPFVHPQGPLLKFPPSQEEVDNSCLCKYRYVRYFSFYAKVAKQGSDSIIVFQDLGYNDAGFLNYDTQSDAGYSWKLYSGPTYLGCYPMGSFTTGQWLDVQLPYKEVEELLQNTSVPSPYCITEYKEPYNNSLKCMIVCSYKCCNGVQGCGIQIPRISSDSWYQSDFPLCVAQYIVTGIGTDEPKATLIQGTQSCICDPPFRVKKMFIQHDCSTVTLRAYHQMLILPGQHDFAQLCQEYCPICQEGLAETALSWAEEMVSKNRCVWWILWVWNFPQDCNECAITKLQPTIVEDFSGVPSEVLGKGAGWMPLDFHKTERKDYCNPSGGGVAYQWSYIDKKPEDYNSPNELLAQIAASMPSEITQNPCKQNCFFNGQLGTISDSLADISDASLFPQSQLPCNIPDTIPRVYRDFEHAFFNVWYLKVSKEPDSLFNPFGDPCYSSYKIDPESLVDGKLKWSLQQAQKTDYELQQLGYFKATQFLHFKKHTPNKFFLPLDVDEEPPENMSDSRLKAFNFQEGLDGFFLQDPSENLCRGLYQVYLMKCGCPDPCSDSCSESQQQPVITSSVCSKWRYVGKVSQQQLQSRGICQGKWAISTVQNTFSDPLQGPIGECVYSVMTDSPVFCGEYPQAPEKNLWYAVIKITPATQESNSFEVSLDSIEFAYCDKAPSIIQGFKSENDPQGPADISVEGGDIYPPSDCCQIYLFKYLQVHAAVYNALCQAYQPSFTPSIDLLLYDINWNYPRCLDYKLYVLYAYVEVQLACQNVANGGFDSPLNWQLALQTVQPQEPGERPVISDWNWGWLEGSNPEYNQPLIVNGNTVEPKVQGSSQSACKIYYVYKIAQVWFRQPPEEVLPQNLPDLAGTYVINWDYVKCLGPTIRKYIRYRYKAFSPTCQNHSGIPNQIIWQYAIKTVMPNASNGTFGWKDFPDGALLSVSSGGLVSPGNLCTIYYTQFLQAKIDCDEPASGEWSPDSSFPVPDLSRYVIDWNLCNCIQYGRWVVTAIANVTPKCELNSNNVSWGANSAKFLCKSSTTQPHGWYNAAGTTSLTSTNTGVQPGSACRVTYKYIMFDGSACGSAPSVGQPPASVTNMLSSAGINWTDSCRGLMTYLHWMVYTYAPTCEYGQPRYAQQTNKNLYSSAYSTGASIPTIIEGWKNVANPFSAATGSMSPTGCNLYYVRSLASYSACSASNITEPSTGGPPSFFTTTWPQSCNPGNYYLSYTVCKSVVVCGSNQSSCTASIINLGKNSSAAYASAASVTTGWYTGSNPFTATSLSGYPPVASACSAFYIVKHGLNYACSSSAFTSAVTPTDIQWPQSCNPPYYKVFCKQYGWQNYYTGTPSVIYTWSTDKMTQSAFDFRFRNFSCQVKTGAKPDGFGTAGGQVTPQVMENGLNASACAAGPGGGRFLYYYEYSSCGITLTTQNQCNLNNAVAYLQVRHTGASWYLGNSWCPYLYNATSIVSDWKNRSDIPILAVTGTAKAELPNIERYSSTLFSVFTTSGTNGAYVSSYTNVSMNSYTDSLWALGSVLYYPSANAFYWPHSNQCCASVDYPTSVPLSSAPNTSHYEINRMPIPSSTVSCSGGLRLPSNLSKCPFSSNLPTTISTGVFYYKAVSSTWTDSWGHPWSYASEQDNGCTLREAGVWDGDYWGDQVCIKGIYFTSSCFIKLPWDTQDSSVSTYAQYINSYVSKYPNYSCLPSYKDLRPQFGAKAFVSGCVAFAGTCFSSSVQSFSIQTGTHTGTLTFSFGTGTEKFTINYKYSCASFSYDYI